MVVTVCTRPVSHNLTEYIVLLLHFCALFALFVLKYTIISKVRKHAFNLLKCNKYIVYVYFHALFSIWPGKSDANLKWPYLSNQPSVSDEPNDTLYRRR